MDKASDFESEDCGFDPRQGLAGYFFPSVPGRKWLENIFKIITTGGVRTHAGILPLDLKSNALTTRPPWCWRNGKSDGNHCFHHQQSRASWSFRITRTLLLRYQHKSQANKQTNKETDGQSDEQVDKRKRKQNQERKWTTLEENVEFNQWEGSKSWRHHLPQKVPTPGIEPGPPGWKPGILTTRPYGICLADLDHMKYYSTTLL